MATEHDDVEVEGILIDTTPKSYKFQGDYWDKAEFVPISQSTLVMHSESTTPGKATLYIKRWLCKKNGWVED